jgi:hypothetical protein
MSRLQVQDCLFCTARFFFDLYVVKNADCCLATSFVYAERRAKALQVSPAPPDAMHLPLALHIYCRQRDKPEP